jgi:fructose-specific PTS system IIB-like component
MTLPKPVVTWTNWISLSNNSKPEKGSGKMKVIAVTACPSGVAHTYMAAEAIEMAAKEAGFEIKVETQGSIGIENALTKEDITSADYVVLTKDMQIKNETRFSGKTVVRVSVGDAIKKSNALMKKLQQHYDSKNK